MRGGPNTSGSGEAMQTRNTSQGERYKKSIAWPRCISGPIRPRYLSRCHELESKLQHPETISEFRRWCRCATRSWHRSAKASQSVQDLCEWQDIPANGSMTANKRPIAMSPATTMKTMMRASLSTGVSFFGSTAVQPFATMRNPPAISAAAAVNSAISNSGMSQLFRMAPSVVGSHEDRTTLAHLLGAARAADDLLAPEGAPKVCPKRRGDRSRAAA